MEAMEEKSEQKIKSSENDLGNEVRKWRKKRNLYSRSHRETKILLNMQSIVRANYYWENQVNTFLKIYE